MFCIDERSNKITLTKGDTATMLVQAFDLDGIEYEIKNTDVIKLTIKKNPSSTAVITKTADSDHFVTIYPADTASVNPGLYVYDVQITTEDGYVYTIVPTSYFQLTEEVSTNG